MYNCEICKQSVPRRTKAIRIPVKTRVRQYPSQQKEIFKRGESKMITVPGGTGTEIVHEIVVCPACAEKYHNGSTTVPAVSMK